VAYIMYTGINLGLLNLYPSNKEQNSLDRTNTPTYRGVFV